MNEQLRLRRAIQFQGIVFTVIFLSATLGYAGIFFLEEPQKHGFHGKYSVEILGGLGIAVFGAMTCLGIYTLAAYYVEGFSISGTTISVRSVFQNRTFDIRDVRKLTWGVRPVWGRVV